MSRDDTPNGIQAELIEGWLRARSIARGLPAPVADGAGWRVDTAERHELRRYVFARADEGLRILAGTIVTPRIFLKSCCSEHEMRALLPPRWKFLESRYLMSGEDYCAGKLALAPGYTLQLSGTAATTAAYILTRGGDIAASGHAAEAGGVFIYDRIVTEPGHQRRGLARYLMQTLHHARRSSQSRQILVATVAGQALYCSLGWRTRSPYTTAHIPG
jgi:GNAT superfamily N-acetyltransferase